MPHTVARRSVSVLALAVVAVGCATTTVDERGDVIVATTADTAPTNVDDAAPVTVPDDAPPVDDDVSRQLTAIGDELGGLGFQISGDGDEDATIALIEERWRAIRDGVDAERPDLTGQFQVTVDMARTAVDRNRPADADKALGLFNVLVENSGFTA